MYHPVDRLRLRHLRLLELIDTHPSLRSVAEEMNLSQPAVSQMVKDLEAVLGATLLERSVRGVTLNAAGRLALVRARAGLAFLDQLPAEIEARERPLLRIGTNPAVMMHQMPMAIRMLGDQALPFRYSIRSGLVREMVAALAAGEIDCYIGRVDWPRIDRNAADMLICHPLSVTPLHVACAADHPLARQGPVRPEQLLDYPWASSGEDSSNWTELGQAMRHAGLRPPVPVIETDLTGLLGIAAGTELLVCLPLSALYQQVRAGILTLLKIEDFSIEPAQADFVAMIAPEEGSQMAQLLAAMKAVVTVPDAPWEAVTGGAR